MRGAYYNPPSLPRKKLHYVENVTDNFSVQKLASSVRAFPDDPCTKHSSAFQQTLDNTGVQVHA
jgi:hypothetical protein